MYVTFDISTKRPDNSIKLIQILAHRTFSTTGSSCRTTSCGDRQVALKYELQHQRVEINIFLFNLAFDANKMAEVNETAKPYGKDVLLYGYFDSTDWTKAKLLAASHSEYKKLLPNS